MSGIIISKLKFFSFAKFFAILNTTIFILATIFDLIYTLVMGASYLYNGPVTMGMWALYSLINLVVVPLATFIGIYIILFIINMVLKLTKGLEIETM